MSVKTASHTTCQHFNRSQQSTYTAGTVHQVHSSTWVVAPLWAVPYTTLLLFELPPKGAVFCTPLGLHGMQKPTVVSTGMHHLAPHRCQNLHEQQLVISEVESEVPQHIVSLGILLTRTIWVYIFFSTHLNSAHRSVRWHRHKQQERLTHADIDRRSYDRANATGQNTTWDLLHRQATKVPGIGLSRATGHATGAQAAGLTATAL